MALVQQDVIRRQGRRRNLLEDPVETIIPESSSLAGAVDLVVAAIRG